MKNHFIHKSTISAHHGYIDCENELGPTITLLNKHPEINMIEIDFVYINEKFISSHDYDDDSISRGTEMSIWFDNFIKLGIIIWIDIKESNWSILSDKFSKFDVNKFYLQLELQRKKFLQQNIILENQILISCQYDNIKEKLFILNNNNTYLLAHDLPLVDSYIAQTVAPSFFDEKINYMVQESMQDFINYSTTNLYIVCLDITFFNSIDDLIAFINKINVSIVILYSMEISDSILISGSDKQFIYQYNYYSHQFIQKLEETTK